jgi:hypothetical protein
MHAMLAAVFSAAFLSATAAQTGTAAHANAGLKAASETEWCSFWYQECHFCEGPTYEMICDISCYLCPGDSEPTCQETGMTCGGHTYGSANLFAPKAAAANPFSSPRRTCS